MRQFWVAALVLALLGMSGDSAVLAGWAIGAGRDLDAADGSLTAAAGTFRLPVPGPVARVFVPPPGPYAAGHRGVDLAAAPGSVVRAAGAGSVAFSGPVAGRWWLTIRHGGGLETTYGGLARAAPAGRQVRAGDVVGVIAPDADHLDWGARSSGAYLDPLSLLGRWRVHLVAAPVEEGR